MKTAIALVLAVTALGCQIEPERIQQSECAKKKKAPSGTDSVNHGIGVPVWEQPDPVSDTISDIISWFGDEVKRHGTCGPTAAANLLAWYCKEKKPSDIEPDVRWIVGVPPSKLRDYFKDKYPELKPTLYTNAKNWTDDQIWDWLLARLAEGRPVLAGLYWETTDGGNDGHYVVIVGAEVVDGKKKLVIMHWGTYEIAYWDDEWVAADGRKMKPFKELWKNAYFGPNPCILFEGKACKPLLKVSDVVGSKKAVALDGAIAAPILDPPAPTPTGYIGATR